MTLGWPPELPNLLQADLTSEPNDKAIRSSMESGPIKIRLRDTVDFESHSGSISCNAAQSEIFKAFWKNDHKCGAVPFEWIDPDTGVAKMYRMVAKYQQTRQGGGRSKFSFQVEEVPS